MQAARTPMRRTGRRRANDAMMRGHRRWPASECLERQGQRRWLLLRWSSPVDTSSPALARPNHTQGVDSCVSPADDAATSAARGSAPEATFMARTLFAMANPGRGVGPWPGRQPRRAVRATWTGLSGHPSRGLTAREAARRSFDADSYSWLGHREKRLHFPIQTFAEVCSDCLTSY